MPTPRTRGTDFIKVGTTKNVPHRMVELQRGCPYELELLMNRPGSYTEERQMKDALAGYHVRGEWYEVARREVSVLLF
jgi:hypothetical protein